MRNRRIRAALAMGLLLSLAWAGSFALWSDDEVVAADFSTGQVDISATTDPTVDFVAGYMAPGDEVYGGVTVTNSSAANALQVKYNMSTSIDLTVDPGAVLAAALTAEVRAVSGACDAVSFGAASGNVMAGPTALSGLSIGAWRGPLDPGQNEIACFKVSLPISDTASENLSTSATFTFHAEQTANNP